MPHHYLATSFYIDISLVSYVFIWWGCPAYNSVSAMVSNQLYTPSRMILLLYHPRNWHAELTWLIWGCKTYLWHTTCWGNAHSEMPAISLFNKARGFWSSHMNPFIGQQHPAPKRRISNMYGYLGMTKTWFMLGKTATDPASPRHTLNQLEEAGRVDTCGYPKSKSKSWPF